MWPFSLKRSRKSQGFVQTEYIDHEESQNMIKSGWQKSATVWIFAKNPPLAVENLIKIHHTLDTKLSAAKRGLLQPGGV